MTKWTGTKPEQCDCCFGIKGSVELAFIDGRTKFGPWAIMCDVCHPEFGTGLGTGHGQRYEKQEDGSFLKVAG